VRCGERTQMAAGLMKTNRFSWDFWAVIVLMAYAFLQIIRWPLLPGFVDIYYHLLTAWGFIQAGGYSSWDFWQYAPVGRPHLYPPLFHIILALFMKAGIDGIFLAKLFEVAAPILFLSILWRFVSKYYSPRLAFWSLIAAGSSVSFYASLAHHIPSTIAMVFGILSLSQLFKKNIIRAALLLALCFYTHIGTSWFFAATIIFYGLLDREYRKTGNLSVLFAIVLASPLFTQQLFCSGSVYLAKMSERYFCEFKVINYILAAIGVALLFRRERKYRLFLAFFAASFIYIAYPSRLFSSEGYLPIIILSAVFLDAVSGYFKFKALFKYVMIILIVFVLVFSPTIVTGLSESGKPAYELYFLDSGLINAIFPVNNGRVASQSIWLEKYYLPVVKLIKENSEPGNILFSSVNIVGVCLAGISGRPTANYLLPEVASSQKFDPVADSKIIITLKDDDPSRVSSILRNYHLVKIGENDVLNVYKNPATKVKVRVKKAPVTFKFILAIFILWIIAFLTARKDNRLV